MINKAIVTGANGFIGAAVCRELANRGIKVIAVVRGPQSSVESILDLENIRIEYCDLSSYVELPKIIEDRDIEVFYHFAWVGTAGALKGDDEVQINNVKYTCDAVRACSNLNCRRFVFAASIMEYEIEESMKTECTPGINTLYCTAKLAADYMARTVAGEKGINYIRAIISNVYGPGETSPRMINSSLRKMINAEHCSFTEGNQIYDFIYIDDVAKAFAEIGAKGKGNKTYYLGSLSPKPLKEFLIEMRDCVDPNLEIGLGEIPFVGKSLSYNEFDIHAVRDDTGFEPLTPFDEGIRRTIDWIKARD